MHAAMPFVCLLLPPLSVCMVVAESAAADWPQVSQQLAHEWSLRKRLAPTVTTPSIEKLIQHGQAAGAQAAKICGAGGGGCILFMADPSAIPSIRKTLVEKGASVLDAAVNTDGLQVHAE